MTPTGQPQRGSVLNLGSMNLDHVYAVPRFVHAGETLGCTRYTRGAGGKGFNQSIALARAGMRTRHVGAVGADGTGLLDMLRVEGVDVSAVRILSEPTGHAIIQVTPDGENCILICGGANGALQWADVSAVINAGGAGDWLLCQNETPLVSEAISLAYDRGYEIWFNPAPMTAAVRHYPLTKVHGLIINHSEGMALTGETAPQAIAENLSRQYPCMHVVLTLGADGVRYARGSVGYTIRASVVKAVDSTAAGDTFVGYLLAGLGSGSEIVDALARANAAAALAVTRHGAADSIPTSRDVDAFIRSA
jgi:ribokinase